MREQMRSGLVPVSCEALLFWRNVRAVVSPCLKHGVSCVLVFMGVKLILGRIYHIPPTVVCAVLVSANHGLNVGVVHHR